MYEDFYGFKEKPFSMLPDPDFLYLSKKHQTALTLLEYGILNHVGFCVITGEPGAGKTTLIRALLQRIEENISVGLITNTHQSFGGLLDWVLSAFDLHQPDLTSVEMHQIFMEYLIKEYAKNRTVLLIVDEAQNMKPDTLEELRMLSNVNTEKDQVLQVVLSGQPALKEMLIKPELMQFAQRIGVDYHLNELNLEETCGYIQHRLKTAGATRDVFTPAACERIYNYSGGTPRLINLLCETVLVYGFADQLEVIEFDLVDEMVHERMKGSVVPIVNRDVNRPYGKKANDKLKRDFPWIAVDNEAEGLISAIENIAVMTSDEKSPIVPDEDAASVDSAVPEELTELDASDEATDVQGEVAEVIPQEKKTESISVEDDPQVEKVLEENVPSTGSANKPAPDDERPSVENKVVVEATDSFIKYGVIAIVLALILIIVAVMLRDLDDENLEVIEKEKIESQERERLRSQQLLIADEALKKELEAAALMKREEERVRVAAEKKAADDKAAIEKKAAEDKAAAEKKAVEDKAAKKQVEKKAAQQTTEEKALAAKTAKQKKVRDEQKRIAIIKEKEREDRYAAEREKRKAEKIAEEKRLRDEEDARRLEQEWLENERKNLESLDSSKINEPDAKPDVVVEKAVILEKDSNPDCNGPAARFKTVCR